MTDVPMIYWYIDRIEKGHKKIKRIQVWDSEKVYYYVQDSEGDIIDDESEPINPKPHTLYKKEGDEAIYYKGFGFIPFFRLDNNKKQFSCLKTVKDLCHIRQDRQSLILMKRIFTDSEWDSIQQD